MTTALRLHRQQCRNRSARSVYSVHSAWQVRRGFAATAGSSALRWRFPALWQLPPRLCSVLPQAWFWRATLGHVTEFVDRHENAEIHGRRDNQEIQYRAKYRAERNRRIIECDCQQTIHIRFAENHGDERINHIVDNRVNHCGDGTAHDDTDRHVDHVAACNEFLKSFNHDDSPIM